jgi:hypothetical protein
MLKTDGPTQEHINHGVEYCFDFDGTVSCRSGDICWLFDVRGGFFDSPCEFREPTGAPVMTVRKVGFLSGTFEMAEQGTRVGMVRRLNALRTRYRIELPDGLVWEVRVPLYSMHFHAKSNGGAQIFLLLQRGPRWFALTEPRSNEPRILMALAFIYRCWQSA